MFKCWGAVQIGGFICTRVLYQQPAAFAKDGEHGASVSCRCLGRNFLYPQVTSLLEWETYLDSGQAHRSPSCVQLYPGHAGCLSLTMQSVDQTSPRANDAAHPKDLAQVLVLSLSVQGGVRYKCASICWIYVAFVKEHRDLDEELNEAFFKLHPSLWRTMENFKISQDLKKNKWFVSHLQIEVWKLQGFIQLKKTSVEDFFGCLATTFTVHI